MALGVIWTPIERDWLAEQLAAVLPDPDLVAALPSGVPLLLEAMPSSRRLALRFAVWWVASASRRRGVGAVLAEWAGSDRSLRREVVAALKLTAALIWEADGAGTARLGWGDSSPVVLPERRALLDLPPDATFRPEGLH